MEIIFYAFSYLFGSVSSAIIICRIFGLPDPRTYGSGNAGAANVSRSGGKKMGALVMASDAAKGCLVAFLASSDPLHINPSITMASIAVLAGHIYPVFFKFKGGKGVATSFGILLVITPVSAVIAFFIYLVGLKLTRISSVSIFAAMLFFLAWQIVSQSFNSHLYTFLALTIIIIFGLRQNIMRLILKKENSIG